MAYSHILTVTSSYLTLRFLIKIDPQWIMYGIPLGTKGITCAIYPLHSMHVLKGQTILMTMTTVLALKTVIEPKAVAQGYVILVWDLSRMVIHKRKVHLRKETFPSFTGTEEGESNGWDSPGTEEDGNHDWDSRGTEEGGSDGQAET